jgi:hypothetical protein
VQPVTDQGGGVVCPKHDTSGSGLPGFGAPSGDWMAAHPVDPSFAGEFGQRLPNGKREFQADCSKGGRVFYITMNFDPPISATEATTTAMAQLPSDAARLVDKVNAKCEIIQLKSVTLAAKTGGEDPDGGVFIDLMSPGLDAGATYDPTMIDQALVFPLSKDDDPASC